MKAPKIVLLSAGANGTSTIELIEPNTMFEERLTLLDLRLSKRFRLGQFTTTGNVDVSNVFNANPLTVVNTQYGSQWLNGLFVLTGRLVKFGVQMEL